MNTPKKVIVAIFLLICASLGYLLFSYNVAVMKGYVTWRVEKKYEKSIDYCPEGINRGGSSHLDQLKKCNDKLLNQRDILQKIKNTYSN